MKQIPIWQQYGFSSEKEFLDRYPEYRDKQPKPKRSKRKRIKAKSRKR